MKRTKRIMWMLKICLLVILSAGLFAACQLDYTLSEIDDIPVDIPVATFEFNTNSGVSVVISQFEDGAVAIKNKCRRESWEDCQDALAEFSLISPNLEEFYTTSTGQEIIPEELREINDHLQAKRMSAPAQMTESNNESKEMQDLPAAVPPAGGNIQRTIIGHYSNITADQWYDWAYDYDVINLNWTGIKANRHGDYYHTDWGDSFYSYVYVINGYVNHRINRKKGGTWYNQSWDPVDKGELSYLHYIGSHDHVKMHIWKTNTMKNEAHHRAMYIYGW
jgi:hypothetical protein